MNAGLCSVTFRSLSVEEIISLCKQNGLTAVEWGGDIHVPVGQFALAEAVGKLTRKNGLQTPSYGSYFRCNGVEEFEKVSQTATALGANVIRIWAGNKDAEETSVEEYQALVNVIKGCASIAKEAKQTLVFEYHYGTYCNGAQSTLRLLRDVNCANVKCYFQPAYWKGQDSFTSDMDAIRTLKDDIVGVHVYHWSGFDRLPLAHGIDSWKGYASLLGDVNYFLEFMPNDDVTEFSQNAQALLDIIRQVQ